MSSQPTKPFLTADWRWLVMLNYEVDPAVLTPLVPPGVELDAHAGRTFVSMVGFQFINTRLLGAPIPGHQHFEEINLRFYVRRETAGELRRGVVFVREIVPRRAIAWVARWVYGEPYLALPTRSDFSPPTPGERPAAVGYSWRYRGDWMSLSAEPRGDALEPAEGSEEEFITEHYWGYTRHSEVAASEYQVEHPRWKLWNVDNPQLVGDLRGLYGDAFAGYLRGTPSSAFVADGSAVIVRRRTKITTPAPPPQATPQPDLPP